MKKRLIIKSIFGAAILGVMVFVQSNFTSKESDSTVVSLQDFYQITIASAETSGSSSCEGSKCDDANDHSYTTVGSPDEIICCGIVAAIFSGDKAS